MRILRWTLLVLGCLGIGTPVASAAITPYVVGGTPALAGDVPFAAFIQADVGGGFFAFCSGSVVAPNLILTAAHCVLDDAGQPFGPEKFLVSAGSVAYLSGKVFTVSAVHVYPYLSLSTLAGDAALLTLTTPTDAVPVRLATTADAAPYAAGQPAVIAGWGVTNPAVPDISPTLQQGTVGVLTNAACKQADPHFVPSFDLCTAAAGFHPAVCNGDSGGPLLSGVPGSYVQIGITSYGAAATCATTPDYFTRVSTVQPWIASVIAGTAAPARFQPAFVAPAAPLAALSGDGVVASFTAPAADPASLLTAYTVTLLNAAGTPLSSQTLVPGSTSATFPSLQPGGYLASVTATYSDGTSLASVSPPVTLAPPANVVRPKTHGSGVVGSTLQCSKGSWAWPGVATFSISWLRSGRAIGFSGSSYRVGTGDAGKRLACAVTLMASTGPTAAATSEALLVTVPLVATRLPSVKGTAALGATLTCAAGTWKHTGSLALAYRWLRDGHVTSRPATRSLTVATADLGHALSCRVTAIAGKQKQSAESPRLSIPAV